MSLGEKIAIAVGIIQALTFLALLWYAWETRRLRQETGKQVRISVMPVLRVLFHRAPEGIFVENVGQGTATKAVLQGFRFKSDDGNTWRQTFHTVNGIEPGAKRLISGETELEPTNQGQRYALDGRAVFEHMHRAIHAGKETLVLALYWTDILGHAYRSDIAIDATRLSLFREHGSPQPATALPPKETRFCPDSLDPV